MYGYSLGLAEIPTVLIISTSNSLPVWIY